MDAASFGQGVPVPKLTLEPRARLRDVNTTNPQIRTVAYAQTWSVSMSRWATRLDFSKSSYVTLAFAKANKDGNITLEGGDPKPLVNAGAKSSRVTAKN